MAQRLAEMMLLAKNNHAGQKYGEHDYFDYHILGVLSILTTLNEFKESGAGMMEDMMIVAVGHDIIEDTDITSENLVELGFDTFIINQIQFLSRDNQTSKERYIQLINKHPVAHAVKKADTLFNLNESLKINDQKRIKKYSEQLAKLSIVRH